MRPPCFVVTPKTIQRESLSLFGLEITDEAADELFYKFAALCRRRNPEYAAWTHEYFSMTFTSWLKMRLHDAGFLHVATAVSDGTERMREVIASNQEEERWNEYVRSELFGRLETHELHPVNRVAGQVAKQRPARIKKTKDKPNEALN